MYEELKKLGLTGEEISVYTFLLKNPSSKVLEISRELNIARTSAYRLLDSLLDKGIVSQCRVKNIKTFNAIDPQFIPDIYEERVEELRSIIPDLEAIRNTLVNTASVELLRGKESFKMILNDALKENKEYVYIGDVERFFEYFEFTMIQWAKKAEKLKLKGRIITRKIDYIKISKYEEIRFLPGDITHSTSTWVYGDKTAIFIWTEPLSVILIHNSEIAKSNKDYFEHMWKNCIIPSDKDLKIMRGKYIRK